jgi:hypothetical protein
MHYNREDFLGLMKLAEAQDCDHLDGLCTARKYEFTGKSSKPVVIPGCGNSALFTVPYTSLPKAGAKESVESEVTACAVDDNMLMWPRFGGDRYATISPRVEDTLSGMDPKWDWEGML